MSDLSKVVQELKITNQKLEILEKQNIEAGTPKERALDALPEILAGRSDTNKSIKEDEKRDKSNKENLKEQTETSLKSTDQVSTEILKQDDILVQLDDNAAKRDEIKFDSFKNMEELMRLQTIQNERIGPPSQTELDNIKILKQSVESEREQLAALEQQRQDLIQQSKSNNAVNEELEDERVKSLKEVFNSSFIGKGILSISKSISGFVGGMLSGVKSGGEAILKGLITAGALGGLIAFLKSDTFKDFLSEENIKRLAAFYKSVKDYFKDLYKKLADPANRESLLNVLKAAGIGVSILAIVSGVKLVGGIFKKIGAMFGLKSSLGLANTQLDKDIAAANKSSKAGLKRSSKFLRFLKLGGFIGLALASIEGVQEGFKAYSEGADAKEIFGRFVGGVTESLTFGILDAKKTAAFLGLGGPEAKIKKVEEQIKKLDKMIAEGQTTITETGRGGIKRVTVIAEQKAKLQSELEELKEEKIAKDNRKKNREIEAQFEKDKKAFLEERAKEIGIKATKKRGLISQFEIREKEKYDKAIAEFEKKFGKAAKLIDDRTPKDIEKELAKIQSSVPVLKVIQELTSTPGVNIQNLKSDVGAFGGMGQTVNVNTVNKAGDTQNIQNNKTIANNQVGNVNLPFSMTRSAYPF